MSGRLRAEAGVTSVEYVGFGVVIAAVIVVLFALDPSLADRLRSPIDDQVCDVLRADCEGERLPAGDRVAGGGVSPRGGDVASTDDTAADTASTDDTAAPPWLPEQPCVQHAATSRFGGSVLLAVFEFGGDGGYMHEELADGRHRVTWHDEGEVGLSLGGGGGLGVQTGEGELAARAELRGGLSHTDGTGEIHVFDSRNEADGFISDRRWDRRIERMPAGSRWAARGPRWAVDRLTGHERSDSQPEQTYRDSKLTVKGEARAGSARGGGELAGGRRVTEHLADGRTETTYLLEAEAWGQANLGKLARLGGEGSGQVAVTVSRDPDGGLLALSLSGASALEGTGNLKRAFAGDLDFDRLVEGLHAAGPHTTGAAGVRGMLEATLRFTDDADAVHAERLVSDLLGGSLAAGSTMYEWARDEAEVVLTVHATSERNYGAFARGRKVIGVGAEGRLQRASEDLLNTWYWDRDAGGLVERDCAG